MRRSRRSTRLGGVLCAILVAGCGSSKPSLSASASVTLAAEVAGVRAAVTNNDLARAHAQLSQLRLTVADLAVKGQLSASRVSAILTSAAEVDAQLGAEANSPPTTTTITSTTALPAEGKGHGKGRDHSGD